MMSLDAVTLRASWRSWWSTHWDRRGPPWLQYAWTLLFNTGIAALLTVAFAIVGSSQAPLADVFLSSLWFSQCIGFSIHLLFDSSVRLLGRARIEGFSSATRVIYYCGVPIAGVFFGYAIAFALRGQSLIDIAQRAPRSVLGTLFFSILISAILYQFFKQKWLTEQAETARERERVRALAAEKQALDAQLRSLQAQIEPHFLFNTLANVVSLIEPAPARARQMLERLIELLRARLSASRALHGTVAEEFDLLRAYLEILAIRMGPRLSYSIDLAPVVGQVRLPPLLVQPLVENAIRHGLEPKVDGGALRVRAQANGDTLEIEVSDSGLGFAATTSGGVGLSNLRERLAALYGDRARLTIEDASPGTCARIVLPREV